MIKFLIVLVSFWPICAGAELAPCTTPNGEKARCQPLSNCEILLPALTSKDPTVKKFFEASKCGDFMVCCGAFANYTERSKEPQPSKELSSNLTKESHREYVIKNLLPSKRFCGLQHLDDYFNNYTTTSVDEFPWLVYIKQKNIVEIPNASYEFKCVGSIISTRYVITSTDCADNTVLPLEEIRVGQYNRFKDSDCIETPYGPDCADPATRVEIEEKLTFHKIGLVLLRLTKGIKYSDFVRPICLPVNETVRAKVGDTVISSGWGDFPGQGVVVTIKKKVAYRLTDPPEERKNNSDGLVFVEVFNSTIEDKEYAYDCSGDEGGPLMYKFKLNWFIEALISSNSCLGVPSWRLSSEAIEWILDNMRP